MLHGLVGPLFFVGVGEHSREKKRQRATGCVQQKYKIMGGGLLLRLCLPMHLFGVGKSYAYTAIAHHEMELLLCAVMC